MCLIVKNYLFSISFFLSIICCTLPVAVCGNSGEEIYNEQQSIADDDADSAYDSLTDKLSPDSIYDSVMGQVDKNKGKNPIKVFLKSFYSTYAYIRMLSPIIGIAGILIGILIAGLARINKPLRRFGIVFAITVPTLLVIIVFGIGYLNSLFLR